MTRISTLTSLAMTAALAFGGATVAQAKSPDASSEVSAQTVLTLTVANISDVSGALMISVVDQAGYDGQPVTATRIPVTADSATATLSLPADGDYAVKMFHDIDGNGQMDMSPFGMPMEPYAFSNDARGRFGPPSWEQTKFSVTGETAHTITLRTGA